MLFGETVAVYCESHMEHIGRACTSQETHYVSTTEPNRLCSLGKQSLLIVRTTDLVRTSQETYYVSATEPNRLMLFGETVAVNCENHGSSPYLTGNTLRLRNRAQQVNAVRGNSRCFL
jgi:hypothetical protein